MSAISVSHLTRKFTTHIKQPGLAGALRGLFRREYQTVTAVDDVSFEIERGEFVGFLGPNGAGKTTTLKILSGVVHPTSGEVRVLGYQPWQRQSEFQRRFALVLGQKNQLWWDLPAYDSFLLNRDIYDVPHDLFKTRVDELCALLDLEKVLRVPVRRLSLGERMKCEVVASLLHAPEVLFLDEPTIGLDVISQVRIREFLRDYNARSGVTVILTSHYMQDIEALCKRVIVINEGRAMFDGALKELSQRFANRRAIRFTLSRAANEEELQRVRVLADDVTQEGTLLSLTVPRDEVPQSVAQLLSFLPVSDMAVEDVEIEAVIRDLFSRGAEKVEKAGDY